MFVWPEVIKVQRGHLSSCALTQVNSELSLQSLSFASNVSVPLQLMVGRSADGTPRSHPGGVRSLQEGLQPQEDEPGSGSLQRRPGQTLRPQLCPQGSTVPNHQCFYATHTSLLKSREPQCSHLAPQALENRCSIWGGLKTFTIRGLYCLCILALSCCSQLLGLGGENTYVNN